MSGISSISFQKQLGSILIITGTEIGAGILALPIISAKLGFGLASLIMLLAWIVMTYTAILIADISINAPTGSSFTSLAKTHLGLVGSIITCVGFLLLLYAISIAYISAAVSSISYIFSSINMSVSALLFVFIMAVFVVLGTHSVDWLNRILLTLKMVLLVFACFMLMRFLTFNNLYQSPSDWPVLFIAIPVIVTSFTSHVIIPTLSDYLEKNAKVLYRVIWIGSLIPLLLYFLWLIAILGVLPLNGAVSFNASIFQAHSVSDANIGEVLKALGEKIPSFVNIVVNIFTDISVMTSFLSVSLALYHFNIDTYRLNRFKAKGVKIVLAVALTFIIPLGFVLTNPNLFIRALSYVGICVSVVMIIIPSLMTLRAKHHNYQMSKYSMVQYLLIFMGLIVIISYFL